VVGLARAHAAQFPRPFWILLSGDVFQSLGFGLLMPYLTLYLTEVIDASPALAGVLLALFSLGALAGTPLGGVGSDRLGRRPVCLPAWRAAAPRPSSSGFASDVWLVGR